LHRRLFLLLLELDVERPLPSLSKQKRSQRTQRVAREKVAARNSAAAMTRDVRGGRTSGTVRRAVLAWQEYRYDEAIVLFERALKQNPNNVQVLLDLGRAYGLRYDYDRAEEYLKRAQKLSPRSPKASFAIGETYRKIAQFDRAAEHFQRAADLATGQIDALLQLAEVHERLHALDDAERAITQALQVDSSHPTALYLRAKLVRRRGDSNLAATLLQDFLALPPMRLLEPRWRAWYELGAIRDKEGDYGSAMECFLKAKQLLQKQGRAALAGTDFTLQKNEELVSTITADHFQRWFAERFSPEQDMAVLCGHPRSGTTLIEQVLDAHPGLISADETSVMSDEAYIPLGNHFPVTVTPTDMLDQSTPEHLQQARAAYLRMTEAFLREPLDGRVLLDKNPELTMILPAIVRMFPEIKVIIALRDPRDVCLSCFMQPLPMNSVSASYLSIPGTFKKYAAVMDTWLHIRPMLRNPWIETCYEDNVADLEQEAARVLEFLGLPWDPKVLKFYEHARQKHVRSPTYEAVTQPVHNRAVGRWRNYEKYIEPHLGTLAPYVETFGYDG
jgi:tetratricopeptide (TPR) repeat protein